MTGSIVTSLVMVGLCGLPDGLELVASALGAAGVEGAQERAPLVAGDREVAVLGALRVADGHVVRGQRHFDAVDGRPAPTAFAPDMFTHLPASWQQL